jgi:hypothetical protein
MSISQALQPFEIPCSNSTASSLVVHREEMTTITHSTWKAPKTTHIIGKKTSNLKNMQICNRVHMRTLDTNKDRLISFKCLPHQKWFRSYTNCLPLPETVFSYPSPKEMINHIDINLD